MNELTETQKAYLAGFFDGEGCVSISKFQGKQNKTPTYQLHVVIAQKVDMLAPLCELTGLGSVHDNNHTQGRRYFQWRMSPHEGVEFLKAVLPYLRVKQEETKLAIEFQSKQGHHKGRSGGRTWTVPQEMIDEKETYYQLLRSLKGSSGGNGGRGRHRKE